jgi:Protein of unknown function (DUF992)
MMGYLSKAAGVMLVLALAEPAAAQRIKAGLLTCDVSAGIGLIITSQKQVSCAFKPDQPGRQSLSLSYSFVSDAMSASPAADRRGMALVAVVPL